MAERGLGARSDLHKVGWEVSEFPILCNTCLGDVPYLRMTKAEWDKECKICTRPFIVFRWKPGKQARFKKTEICQTCAKVKNVCQTCLFDLQFGLPVEVRDAFLKEKVEVPKDPVNRDYWAHQMTKNLDNLDLPYDKQDSYPILEKIARRDIYHKRNLPHICSFYVKGNCARGLECPYRHEIPVINELSEQNIKDRFYGINDPVAKKIFKGLVGSKAPKPPADLKITSLYISGLTDDSLRDKDLLQIFSKFGDLKSIKILLKNYCAFVTFEEREAAEKAMNALHNQLTIKDEKYRLSWAKIRDPSQLEDDAHEKIKHQKEDTYEYTTECPKFQDSPNENVKEVDSDKNKTKIIYSVNLNTYDKGNKPYYPSMDPNAEGGELKMKSKKKIKSEERKALTSENKEISGNTNKGGYENSLKRLMEAYYDVNGNQLDV